jgi:glutamyl-Q tRNA(Asp) synthetase
MILVTRFAPSPTGLLHLGHAHSALFGWRAARRAGGRFLLRLEDIDQDRCRPEHAAGILEDLTWLGLDWDGPVRIQSEHFDDYRAALDALAGKDLLYPCFCTRAEIQAEIARAPTAPHGPEGAIYPGTCKGLTQAQRRRRLDSLVPYALRLDLAAALRRTGPLVWYDRLAGRIEAQPERHGDVVLARKDAPASYHLAVTTDDARQGVTMVTRGMDLFEATHVHRVLQALLDLPVPEYHHHRLLAGPDGRRFAKRDQSLTLRALREAGHQPETVRRMAEPETAETETAETERIDLTPATSVLPKR